MTNALKKQLMDMRTRAQANLLLTSRDDLEVQEGPVLHGIDLLVTILKKNRRTGRQFGVILHAHIQKYKSLKQAGAVIGSMISRRDEFDPGPWPICIFSFVMTGREGVYAWLFEPMIGEHGARVRRRIKLECRDLDEDSLEEIVRRVDAFYDALTGVHSES
jgi:hypothetical protein